MIVLLSFCSIEVMARPATTIVLLILLVIFHLGLISGASHEIEKIIPLLAVTDAWEAGKLFRKALNFAKWSWNVLNPAIPLT